MQLGIFAKTFSGESPDEVMAAAAAAGFQAVQYNMACSGVGALPETISPDVAAAIYAATQQHRMQIAAVSATYNMTHPDVAIRDQGRRSFAAIASQAKSMGTKLLTVCSGSKDAQDQWREHPENHSPQSWREMLAEFEALIVIAEQHDVLIGVEPELANIVSSAAKAKLMLQALQSPRVKIVLDPANLFEVAPATEQREIIARAVDTLAVDIIMAHAKDRNGDGTFAAAGTGVIDFSHFFSQLRSNGFSGPIITHGLSAEDAPSVATFLKSALR